MFQVLLFFYLSQVCLIISGCISRKISGKPHSQKLPRETRRLKPAKEDPKEQQQQEQASGGVRQRVVGGKVCNEFT